MRKKLEAQASAELSREAPPSAAATGSSQSWAMLIERARLLRKPSEADPLSCQECGGPMRGVSFIEPPQSDVIEAILSHCGLRQSRSPRARPDVREVVLKLDAAFAGASLDAPNEAAKSHKLTYVEIDTFLASY